MDNQKGHDIMNGSDYFAKALLEKLDTQDSLIAAYEAQALSREVGFDFSAIDQVLERALDEVREVKEAFEEGDEGREHLGDEIADLVFSLVNLIRHKGFSVDVLPATDGLTAATVEGVELYAVSDDIALDMRKIADSATSNGDALIVYIDSLQKCATLARSYGFNVGDILKANVKKYLLRCQAIEVLAARDQKSWKDLASAGEIVSYWKRAKQML